VVYEPHLNAKYTTRQTKDILRDSVGTLATDGRYKGLSVGDWGLRSMRNP